jgi:hypothetical protein
MEAAVWRKKAVVALLVTLTGVFLAPSCAMMSRSPEQGIPITSTPSRATVVVNGVRKGVTPLTIWLKRKQKGQVIRIESPGYDPVEIRVGKKISGAPLLGNLLLGLIPGIWPTAMYSLAHEGGAGPIWIMSAAAFGAFFTALDGISGAINEFEPKEIIVRLKKADGPPRVDTILLDADELKNVKWIRVALDIDPNAG